MVSSPGPAEIQSYCHIQPNPTRPDFTARYKAGFQRILIFTTTVHFCTNTIFFQI